MPLTIEFECGNPLVLELSNPDALEMAVGRAGPAGRDGANGVGGFVYPAGEDISGHSLVVLIDGMLWYADHSNLSHAGLVRGMTIGAALAGANCYGVNAGGIIEPTWSYAPNMSLYLGSNGRAVTAAPSTGFVLEIGQTVSATEVFIQIGLAYFKA